jgi:hypothetical protein
MKQERTAEPRRTRREAKTLAVGSFRSTSEASKGQESVLLGALRELHGEVIFIL